MVEEKHSEKYEQLFVLDVFANRRAWLEQSKYSYNTYAKTINSFFWVLFTLPPRRIPEWDELPEEIQIAWGESVKAVILEDRKGKDRSASGTHSEGA